MPASAETTGSAHLFAVEQNDQTGQLRLTLGGREAFVYHFAGPRDLPHFHPYNSPSGKNLVVAEKIPWPHHRAFWIADTVEVNGVKGDIYNAYYSGKKLGDKTYGPPFDRGVRHVSFPQAKGGEGRAIIEENLVWETNRTSGVVSLLDEHRVMKLRALDDGGYFMDLSFSLHAAYGDVKFISDDVHYAWPYIRIHPQFSGENGGTITSDSMTTGQKDTNLKPALWIDYSNTLDGEPEGLALFQRPDGQEHRWLTREYGTFGPRRPDHLSGKPFTLKKGESISQRVGVLVHKGDVKSGRVAELYEKYTNGELD